MQTAWELCGDPSRMHQEALQVRQLLEVAREQVAGFFGAPPRSVVFTSGATEAITTVLAAAARRGRHQVTNAVEHSAVNLGLQGLAGELSGHQPGSQASHRYSMIAANPQGLVDPQAMLAAVTADTSLVHLQLCNHETGTVQPVGELAEGCRSQEVWLHSDAAQAAGHLKFSFADLGTDFMSVSSHKLGGPAGVGALLVRRGLRLEPLLRGGDQERARRAGLENLPGIVGFGAACEFLASNAATEIAQQQAFSTQVAHQLASLEGVELLGPAASPAANPTASPATSPAGAELPASAASQRASHISCFYLQDVEPQALVLELDRQGLAVHSGSACSSEANEPSPVLAAMGLDGHNSLRISVGWNTTQADVDALLQAIPSTLAKLRSLKSAS